MSSSCACASSPNHYLTVAVAVDLPRVPTHRHNGRGPLAHTQQSPASPPRPHPPPWLQSVICFWVQVMPGQLLGGGVFHVALDSGQVLGRSFGSQCAAPGGALPPTPLLPGHWHWPWVVGSGQPFMSIVGKTLLHRGSDLLLSWDSQ